MIELFLFLKGDIDMSATTSETAEVTTNSDAEISEQIEQEKEVDFLL